MLDPATGTIRFTPVNGYIGTATPANYAVTDSYGQTGSVTYTPTVTVPAPPTAAPLSSSGTVGSTQQKTVTIPSGGAVTLLSGTRPVATVTIPGQGTYALDADTGVITFTPLAGYSGDPTPVTYQVTDAYGQSVRATYAPTVTKAPATASPPTPTATTSTTPTSTGTGSLSDTGSNVDGIVELAALLLLLGVGLSAAAIYRRRPRSHRHR